MKKGFHISGKTGWPYRIHTQSSLPHRKSFREALLDESPLGGSRTIIAALPQVIKNLQYVSRNKTAVGQPVQSSILAGCFRCLFYNLHTDHFFCYRRLKLGNGSGSAVKIKDPSMPPHLQHMCGQSTTEPPPPEIWLKKGKRTDPESQPQEDFLKPVLTIQGFWSRHFTTSEESLMICAIYNFFLPEAVQEEDPLKVPDLLL